MTISTSGFASPMNIGYLDIEVDKDANMIKSLYDFNPAMMGNSIQAFHQTLGSNFWRSGNDKCVWKNINTKMISSVQTKVSAESYCPEIKTDIALNLHFLKFMEPNYRIIARVNNNGVESTFIVDKIHSRLKIPIDNGSTFSNFVFLGARQWMGAKSAQLPIGFDHLLFIFVLIFTGKVLGQTMKDILGFIIGLSISIVLSTTGIISIPSSIITPAIALSIIYVATEGFLSKKMYNRIPMAVFFGFIHGLSYAYGLQRLKISEGNMMKALMGFNLGVELGLITILLLLIPSIYFVKKYSNYHLQMTRFSAIAIMIVGSYWFIQRVFI